MGFVRGRDLSPKKRRQLAETLAIALLQRQKQPAFKIRGKYDQLVAGAVLSALTGAGAGVEGFSTAGTGAGARRRRAGAR